MIMNYQTKFRVEQLKAAESLMRLCNDEGMFDSWLALGIPDAADESDYIEIAEDDEAYNEILDLLVKLVSEENFRI